MFEIASSSNSVILINHKSWIGTSIYFSTTVANLRATGARVKFHFINSTDASDGTFSVTSGNLMLNKLSGCSSRLQV